MSEQTNLWTISAIRPFSKRTINLRSDSLLQQQPRRPFSLLTLVHRAYCWVSNTKKKEPRLTTRLVKHFKRWAKPYFSTTSQHDVLNAVAKSFMPTATSRVVFEEDSIRRLRRELVLYGLIEASRQETTHYQAGKGNVTYIKFPSGSSPTTVADSSQLYRRNWIAQRFQKSLKRVGDSSVYRTVC